MRNTPKASPMRRMSLSLGCIERGLSDARRGARHRPFGGCAASALCRAARRLREADVVAERVAQPAIDPVRTLGRLFRELDAFGPQLAVGLAAVVGHEEEVPAGATLRDQVADLRGGLVVHDRLTRLLEEDAAAVVAGDADREPAHESEIAVLDDLQSELADVKVESLLLIEYVDLRDRECLEHFRPPGGDAATLRAACAARFSKTARSRPRHRET